MAFTPINKQVNVHKGSGGFGATIGKIAGTGLGAIIGGVATMSPGGAIQGAKLGYGVGGMAGGIAGQAADPARVRETKPISPLGSMSKRDPNVQIATLQQAQNALKGTTEMSAPESAQIMEHLQADKDELKKRIG